MVSVAPDDGADWIPTVGGTPECSSSEGRGDTTGDGGQLTPFLPAGPGNDRTELASEQTDGPAAGHLQVQGLRKNQRHGPCRFHC